jgi:hypothetical protein
MKIKIWDFGSDPSSAVEVEAHGVYDAVMEHAPRVWSPEGNQHLAFVTTDEDGTVRDVDVYVEMEPSFDVWIKRRDGEFERPSASEERAAALDRLARSKR